MTSPTPPMCPTPARQPMVPCPHCGTPNDPARGSTKCRECNLPLKGQAAAVCRDAIAAAAQVLTAARAHMATLTPREAALEAYVPGGPSVDELEARVRDLRARTANRKTAAARAA